VSLRALSEPLQTLLPRAAPIDRRVHFQKEKGPRLEWTALDKNYRWALWLVPPKPSAPTHIHQPSLMTSKEKIIRSTTVP
jgi:hypothetical protein